MQTAVLMLTQSAAAQRLCAVTGSTGILRDRLRVQQWF